VSDLANMLECSAGRETVFACVRNLAHQAVQLADELNRARKEVAGEAKRREVVPRHLRAGRLARADCHAIAWRAEAAELRQGWTRPPPSLRRYCAKRGGIRRR
jgi:hypothetical protein